MAAAQKGSGGNFNPFRNSQKEASQRKPCSCGAIQFLLHCPAANSAILVFCLLLRCFIIQQLQKDLTLCP